MGPTGRCQQYLSPIALGSWDREVDFDTTSTQRYNCVMIPPFDTHTGNLPPGIHEATWDEFLVRYGYTPHRLALLAGLKAALDALRTVGCRRVYIDGSFVGAKEAPGDFDGCWEATGVDIDQLDQLEPALLTFERRRAVQKAKFGGELFPAEVSADPLGTRFLEFFQQDRHTGAPKGIVAIDLGALP